MPTERGATAPGPDDFDRQLRDLTSGGAGTPRFREPSAAERAERASRPARRPGRSILRWRGARLVRRLRRPVTSDGDRAGGRNRARGGRYLGGRRRASTRASGESRQRRLRSLAKRAGILVGFVALLYLMHMLGLGPH